MSTTWYFFFVVFLCALGLFHEAQGLVLSKRESTGPLSEAEEIPAGNRPGLTTVDPEQIALCWGLVKNAVYWELNKRFKGVYDKGKNSTYSPMTPGREAIVAFEKVKPTNEDPHHKVKLVDYYQVFEQDVSKEVPVTVANLLIEEGDHPKKAYLVFRGANTEGKMLRFTSNVWWHNVITTMNKKSFVPFRTMAGKDVGRVHEGAMAYYNQLHIKMRARTLFTSLFEEHPGIELVITGFSIGGAFAQMAAVDLTHSLDRYYSDENVERRPAYSISVIIFGSPKVGDAKFVSYSKKMASALRINSHRDPIVATPKLKYGMMPFGPGIMLYSNRPMRPLLSLESEYKRENQDRRSWTTVKGFVNEHRAVNYAENLKRFYQETAGQPFSLLKRVLEPRCKGGDSNHPSTCTKPRPRICILPSPPDVRTHPQAPKHTAKKFNFEAPRVPRKPSPPPNNRLRPKT
uniref:Fungal lipase-type domain-containing protein n=1 Tax=Chromera velia CCMP2878 TaxID=1169474 RepID=A0A0G4GNL4_9ALVE|eukprot:Cvel_4978.t1-p1 / transcript=Cvel_4978.t1 / gene=Cvel_4978 / organism=Chromera_velia_CCMP2878 / gene_product=Lipase, putative / transcript_product=Lipase, putative / location=Cvel_scaffold225:49163-50536(-) / protein_length=458 / sequence_SO=supercontig / SO=protein_coding / is_pseudo=false